MKQFKFILMLFMLIALSSCDDYKYTLIYKIQYPDTTKIDTLYNNNPFNFGYYSGNYYISVKDHLMQNSYLYNDYYYDKYPLIVISYTKEKINNNLKK